MDPSLQKTAYIYLPLEKSRRQTRVFRLESGQDASPSDLLSFRMSHVSLDDHSEYHAISYACGDVNRKTPVLVNGCVLLIYESLEIVLKSFTAQFPDRTWWADALSINQDDNIEKSYQVEQLSFIYSRAHMVMIWLGPGGVDSLEALVGIVVIAGVDITLSEIAAGTDDIVALGSRSKPPSTAWLREYLRVTEQLPDRTRSKIEQLLSATWWERLWTLQETCLARRAALFCGKYRIGYSTVARAYDFWREVNIQATVQAEFNISLERSLPFDMLIARFAERRPGVRVGRNASTFLSLLLRTVRPIALRNGTFEPSFKVTDPRDRMYALLGLVGDQKTLMDKPDYTKSPEQIFMEATRHIIDAGDGVVLAYGGLNIKRLDLPSWVCDWSQALSIYHCTLRWYNHERQELDALESTKAINENFDLSSRTLSLRGYYVERVEKVVNMVSPDIARLSNTDQRMCVEVYKNILQQLLNFHSKLNGLSRRSEPVMEACALALVKGRYVTSASALEVNDNAKCLASFMQILTYQHDGPLPEALREYISNVAFLSDGHRPFITSSGHFGVGPPEMKANDEIVFLHGVPEPMIIREKEGGRSHSLVGQAYVQNIENIPRMTPDVFFRLV